MEVVENIKEQDKKLMLELCRDAIEYYMFYRSFPDVREDLAEHTILSEVLGNFVTLTIDGNLRGCIGNVIGVEPLYVSLPRNAVNAGFYDPRFLPLEPKELDRIKIEVSLLTPLSDIDFANDNELLNYLADKHPGIYLRSDGRDATFLPQVWDSIEDPAEFLDHLCLKAGLDGGCWKDAKLQEYYAIYFDESEIN